MKQVVLIAIALLAADGRECPAADEPGGYYDVVFIPKPPRSYGWRFIVEGNNAYFKNGTRKRQPGDKPLSLKPGDTESWQFAISSEDGPATIELFGNRSPEGYVSADYSTDPPTLTLTPKEGKYSKWRVHRTNAHEGCLENLNDRVEKQCGSPRSPRLGQQHHWRGRPTKW